MKNHNDKYLRPTDIIDSEHQEIVAYAQKCVGDSKEPVKKAIKLFYAVRDDIRYDPYSPFYLPDHYRASSVLKSKRGFCISKASLMCALLRACKIPSRVGFATVRNHLTTDRLVERMGSDLFVYHGYVELSLHDKWIKATPTFNKELCLIHHVAPLEFDGINDALFHPYNSKQEKFMEYIEYHGTFHDIPVDEIVSSWKDAYGTKRVDSWIAALEKLNGKSVHDFHEESVHDE